MRILVSNQNCVASNFALDVGEDVDMCIHRLVRTLVPLCLTFALTSYSYKQRIGIHSAPGRHVFALGPHVFLKLTSSFVQYRYSLH